MADTEMSQPTLLDELPSLDRSHRREVAKGTTAVARLTSSAMISRNRSAPTAAAMSIECTTSANRTVTCLCSADRLTCVTGAPHSLQNLEFGGSSVPHDPHPNRVAVMSSPRTSHLFLNTLRSGDRLVPISRVAFLLPSGASLTSVSCHCW
jgi:hypothetical protein